MGLALAFAWIHLAEAGDSTTGNLDQQLRNTLAAQGFTGRVEGTLEKRLGRPLNPAKAELGRLLFFDKFVGLHGDNSCAGCHSPLNGFGDSQSMAIGVENNDFVGPERAGPRNQRRTPSVVNTAFYPKLMWNGRFSAISGNPFDNSKGFLFPAPEGTTRFPANDPDFQHLLQAQAHIPPTELSEAAGPWDSRLWRDNDGEYFCRVIRASEGIRFLPEAKSYYRAAGFKSISYIGGSPKKLLERLRSSGRLDALKADIAQRKAIEHIADSAKPVKIEQSTSERAAASGIWTPGS